jgi:photosystem II stability/assembly factor-like uncharacterized protein
MEAHYLPAHSISTDCRLALDEIFMWKTWCLIIATVLGVAAPAAVAQNGWAVGGGGTIVHTSNGGDTWSPQTSGTGNTLNGVSFVDADNGWAVADNGTIVHTINGGSTWSSQTSGTVFFLGGVSFVDANDGWAVGNGGTILQTSNGGNTWAPQSSGTGNNLSPASENGEADA